MSSSYHVDDDDDDERHLQIGLSTVLRTCAVATIYNNNNRFMALCCNYLQMSNVFSVILLLHPFNGLFSRTVCVSQHQKGNHSGFYWSKR